jgi:cytochrome c oxidase cbb3-type subunit III
MANSPSEQERLLDHAYDDIQEYDNPLPRWWVWIFWATIVFSLLYAIDVGGFMRGPGRVADYDRSIADAAKQFPKSTGPADASVLAALAHDAKALALGKTVFATNCAICHRADGGGNIGPNLTDEYWLHGGTIAEINATINEGVLDKGMPNWGKMLSPEQVNAVTAYVASLAGSKPADPKPPQGTKREETAK